jgi:hypothetical protein
VRATVVNVIEPLPEPRGHGRRILVISDARQSAKTRIRLSPIRAPIPALAYQRSSELGAQRGEAPRQWTGAASIPARSKRGSGIKEAAASPDGGSSPS